MRITDVDSDPMRQLRVSLETLAGDLESSDDAWPAEQLRRCGGAGVFRWFLDGRWGGANWSPRDIMRGYLELSSACLTTTFVITQRMGACRRLAASENQSLAERLLPDLVEGATFATVGISHLTTSRRHLGKPAMTAVETEHGFLLDGFSAWCTGASHADHVVLGAEMADGRQLLVAVDMDWDGVSCGEPSRLMALNASRTGPVHCRQVEAPRSHLLAGPIENVMQQGIGASTGGLQTSILAVGVARSASQFVLAESERRSELRAPGDALLRESHELAERLFDAADEPDRCDAQSLRQQANSLVTRATQAALAAAKGAGYVDGHVVGRWCREALFFLVWSCPQPVLSANLCELAGIKSE